MSVVDLAATRQEAGFIGKLLKRCGLPTDLGAAIAALAGTIRDHKHFENLLTSVSAADRQDMYDAIKPHLRFRAKPLDVYIAGVGQRAEREQWPTVAPDGSLKAFKPALDVASIKKDVENMIAAQMAKRTLTLFCTKCTAQESFHAIGEETRVAVVMRARKAGWIYDYTVDPGREICPKCPTSLRKTEPND